MARLGPGRDCHAVVWSESDKSGRNGYKGTILPPTILSTTDQTAYGIADLGHSGTPHLGPLAPTARLGPRRVLTALVWSRSDKLSRTGSKTLVLQNPNWVRVSGFRVFGFRVNSKPYLG
mgnify:CR=1 FL=1